MPQYIRENGGIRVIPDDQTTEDGEIDLSPTRKIIDEGNIVIEGRDDGSTVIREKRPTDHTFFGEETERVYLSDDISGSIIPNIFHDSKRNLYLLASDVGVITIDGNNLTLLGEDDSLADSRFAAFHPPTSKFFIFESSDRIHVFEYNSSSGYYEQARFITLTGGIGVQKLDMITSINVLVVYDEEKIFFIDPINETVVAEDDSAGLAENISLSSGIDQSSQSSSRSDRVFYTNREGVFRIVDPVGKTGSNLDNVFPKASDYCYLERLDALFIVNYTSNQGILYDASTLSEINTFDLGTTEDRAYAHPVEKRFVATSKGDLASSDSGPLKLYDPLTGEILDSVSLDKTALTSLSFNGDSSEFLVTSQSPTTLITSNDMVLKKVEYNPFYS